MKTKVTLMTVFALTFLMTLSWQISIAESAEVITDGLLSYWTLDEVDIDGETVKDVWEDRDGTMRKILF